MKRYILLMALLGLDCQIAVAEVVIETVAVGNPGNAADTRYETSGHGGVAYTFNIGKFEITAGQYTEFLNAVARTDTYELYSTSMWTNKYGCKIERAGSSPNYSYLVAPDWAYKPVNFVSWADAARFANWMHNGQPTGAQGLGTTEDGSYALNGATSVAALLLIVREPDATWAVPSEDEWYKAAYYDGGNDVYYDYPTGSENVPVSEACPGGNNSANYYGSDLAIGPPYHKNDVGCYGSSASPYNTFDQGGNVWEWNEAVIGSHRGQRGGSFNYVGVNLHAAWPDEHNPAADRYELGFRVACCQGPDIPAVSTWGLGVMVLLLGIAATAMIRRKGVV